MSICQPLFTPPFLRVEGGRVVDGMGNTVRLRGFNTPLDLAPYERFRELHTQEQLKAGNLSILGNYFTDCDFENMRNLGANMVRIFYPNWRSLEYGLRRSEYEPSLYDDKYLDVIEAFVDRAGQHGIRTLLVMNNAGESSVYYVSDPLKLWTDPERRSQVYAMWEHVAKRFAGNPWVLGYDLMNEPEPPSKAALHEFYQNCIDAIRLHDENHMLFLDTKHFPIDLDVAWGGTYTDANLVLESHFYQFNALPTESLIQDAFDIILNHPERQGRPFYVGEFGIKSDGVDKYGPEELGWIENVIHVMNAGDVHWSYFLYKDRFFHDAASPGYDALYTPSERLFISPTADEEAYYLEFGLPTPTPEQLASLHTEHFQTSAGLRSVLSAGFKEK